MSMRDVPIDLAETPEIEGEATLGDRLNDLGFVAQVNDRPIGLSLHKLFETQGWSVPPDLQLYKRFDLWLIPHGVKVVRPSGNAEVDSVSIRVAYEPGEKTFTTLALLPAPEFIERGGVDAAIRLRGSISALGEADSATEATGIDAGPPHETGLRFHLDGGLKGKVQAGAEGHVDMRLAFSARVVTPWISAAGLRSTRPEWRFQRHLEPLHDRDIETWAVIALPRRETRITFRVQCALTVRTSVLLPRKERHGEWVEVECPLER